MTRLVLLADLELNMDGQRGSPKREMNRRNKDRARSMHEEGRRYAIHEVVPAHPDQAGKAA